MSTGGRDDPMINIDGDFHRLTPRLRWRARGATDIGSVMVFVVHQSLPMILEQAWQNVRTDALVWRPVEIEP